jgi:predicted pyridoxine 5'-phosphate oxidase superfamily flavin-nucleotide-binding protein
MRATPRTTETGFHEGELAVQQRAGVMRQAARLVGMLDPVELGDAIAGFFAGLTFAAITARDVTGRLWVSPLVGEPGFLAVTSPTTLEVATAFPAGDPLRGLPAAQSVGLLVIDLAERQRVRVNGTLVVADPDRLVVEVEQAYGNCQKYIQPRVLFPMLFPARPAEVSAARIAHGAALDADEVALVRRADTFFLGTTHPERGADASHRGGRPGFLRVEGGQLWWPDYPGNNMFNSLGNLGVDPAAALLVPDFSTGRTLALSGTAEVEWTDAGVPGDDGRTGRRVRFTPARLVAGILPAHEDTRGADARTPELT